MPDFEKTAVSRLRPADFIPGYRLEKLVGKGGMGEVHRATQLSLGRTVAVKILASELAKDATFVARFEKEGAALAALSHPNIVAIVDKGTTKDTYYLVMEFIDGPSMREAMRSPLLDSQAALRMALEVCRAIDYAHHRGIIHRDLKPENILFDEQAGGIAKVTDFGLAGFQNDELVTARFNVTQTHVAMGTAAYMAPEQRVDAKSADHRADIYSLGVILYELLVGEVPMGTFDTPSQRKPGLDKRLDAIVARCLKPIPADRYPSVADLLADLEPLVPATTFSHSRRPETRLARLRRISRLYVQRAVRIATLVLLGIAALIILVAVLRSRAEAPPPAGVALSTESGPQWTLSTPGRVDPVQPVRTLTLGEGPDSVAIRAAGRKPALGDSAISFQDDERTGRAVLDVTMEGEDLRFASELELGAPSSGFFARLRSLVLGAPPPTRGALLLVGEQGRFVALVQSVDGSPPALEWALGTEKRGTMSSPSNAKPGLTRLELLLDGKTGRLSAYVGTGPDRRVVGDPLELGSNWRRLFGQVPRPAVGCLDGPCTFRKLRYVAESPSPPPPPPPPVPNPTPPTPPKAAPPRPAVVKKPAGPAAAKPSSTGKKPPKRR